MQSYENSVYYTRNDLTALNYSYEYILQQSANLFVFLNTNLDVFSVIIISWKYSIHPKAILLFYFKVQLLPKTTVKILFYLPTVLVFQDVQIFFVVSTKVPFNLNLMSRFSEGPNSNRTNKEIQNFLFLPKWKLFYQIFGCESQTTWLGEIYKNKFGY